MLRVIPYLCACLLALAPHAMAASNPAPKPAANKAVAGVAVVGSPAPDLNLVTVRGESRTLRQYRGKIVLLNFWASWCPYCREEMPSMDRLAKLFPRGEVVVLAVNVEKKFPDRYRTAPVAFEMLSDPLEQAQLRYGVRNLPDTFVIDRNGIVRDRVKGAIAWDDPTVIRYLQALVRG